MKFERIVKGIENKRDEMVKLCCDLIGFKSENPPANVTDIAYFIRDYFEERGFKVSTYETKKGKVNVSARLEKGEGKKLLWNGHMDVVPAGRRENWATDPFIGVVRDGKIFGRGASDMKSGVAAAMVMASQLSEMDADFNGRIQLDFVPDEETGGYHGTKYLVERGLSLGDACIVGEGTSSRVWGIAVRIAEKGILDLKISALGKTSHASVPFLGENAIDKLMRVLSIVKEMENKKIELPPIVQRIIDQSMLYYEGIAKYYSLPTDVFRQLFSKMTINIGVIKGGVKTNVVPDYAEAKVDIRLLPGQNPEETYSEIERKVHDSGIRGIGLDKDVALPSYENPDGAFVTLVKRCVAEITGAEQVNTIIGSGATDARYIRSLRGIPTVILGPGNQSSHSANEYVDIMDMVIMSKIYTLIALEFLS
ncbi:MAG: M20 family metallopeptidase [Candidatus Jordarchaeum sp.]|uniref:M20 family metallopeptidase n=1 Tax=Candidatus Jordarchaeum sp. TaxID=2823881 RepID=UPI00404AECD2